MLAQLQDFHGVQLLGPGRNELGKCNIHVLCLRTSTVTKVDI